MGYEIELKAHVYNRREVISKMNESDGKYLGHTEKSDVYYRFPLLKNDDENQSEQKYISARIRHEELEFNQVKSSQNYFTYKRKKNVKTADGAVIEVNEENEIIFEGSIHPLEIFFSDLGGLVGLKKEKKVEQWIINLDGEEAHVELCTVPPLGDFLEIEIIKSENDEETVNRCKKIEEKIFKMCNIPLTQIEPKCYRDLLAGV